VVIDAESGREDHGSTKKNKGSFEKKKINVIDN
jgi:hypothetical protein